MHTFTLAPINRASLADTPSTSGSAQDGAGTSGNRKMPPKKKQGKGAAAPKKTAAASKKTAAATRKAAGSKPAAAWAAVPSTSSAVAPAAVADDSVVEMDDSVVRIDDSVPEIDAREFSNNVSAMFDLTVGSSDDGDDDDYDDGGDSSDDQTARGYANRNTLNPDQMIQRMKTMFETSLMLHAKGKYMKVRDYSGRGRE